MTSNDLEKLLPALGIIVTLIVSHIWHSEPPTSTPTQGKTITGGTTPTLLAIALCLSPLFGFGCASANSNTFSAENAAAITADAGMRSYAVYWLSAIGNPGTYNTSVTNLISQRNQVEAASKKIGASIALVEGLRSAYQTNSALQPQLTAAVSTLTGNAAAMMQLVNTFETVTN